MNIDPHTKLNLRFRIYRLFLSCTLFGGAAFISDNVQAQDVSESRTVQTGLTNAADFGFSPDASGVDNTKALQQAVDKGCAIVVGQTGNYKMVGTV